MIVTDTFPGYYYHPRSTREWCATRDELANLLLVDARWRGAPYQDADILTLFDEQGIHSESERQQVWADLYNAEARWHHELTKGRFAYCDQWEKRRSVIPNERVMVALRELVYYRWRRSFYEVFTVQSPLEVAAFRHLGAAVLASKGLFAYDKITARHPPTRRFFLTREAFEEYAERYKRFVLAGGVPSALPPHDPAPTLEPPAAPHSGPGRPADAEWRSWTLQNLIDILKSGLQKARQEPPDKKRQRFQDVADATGYERRDLSRSMNKHGHTWETIRKLLND